MRTNVLIIFAVLLFACKTVAYASTADFRFQQEQLAGKEKHIQRNQLLSFGLLKQDNSDWLLKDYNAEINGDTIEIFIPYLAHFNLKLQFGVDKKARVYANGAELFSGKSVVDFSKPVQFAVVAKGSTHTYTVSVFNSGLPVIYIDTKDAQPIKSKNIWLDSTKMIVYKPNGKVDYDAGTPMAQIKGRGNSTWSARAKRPYALKLNVSSKILGMPENKHWCLLANYFDETLFKNDFALFLGHNYTNLDWTPHGKHVELVLNGNHLGNYYLCEQVRIAKNRVRCKYLVEIEQRERTINSDVVSTLGCKLNIVDTDRKNGDITTKDDEMYVKKTVNQFESELKKIPNNTSNYKEYIDVESFADWYLIKEISKDVDGGFKTSSFFQIDADGKIKMGPIWDFDHSFGDKYIVNQKNNISKTINDNYKGYNVSNAVWYTYLLKDPDFVKIILQKLDKMVADSAVICNYIDKNTEKLFLSVSENRLIYSIKSHSSNSEASRQSSDTYKNEMKLLKAFAINRMVWIKEDLEMKLNKRLDYKQKERRPKKF